MAETREQTSKVLANFSSPDGSSFSFNIRCFNSWPNSLIFTVFAVAHILVIFPLCILILHHGFQEWQQKHSSSSSAASHSDIFTYHMVIVELVGVLGLTLWCCGICNNDSKLIFPGFILEAFTWYGQTVFHILTCVERHLAVVHPIIYLGLRNERGIRVRNLSIGCTWLLCLMGMGWVAMDNFSSLNFCVMLIALIIVSYCSLSVLCALIGPGPGEQGDHRGKVDQSKQRAFFTILTILGVLMLRLTGSLIWTMSFAGVLDNCLIMVCLSFCNIPSSLVLPLLFLHRTGKVVCFKKNIQ